MDYSDVPTKQLAKETLRRAAKLDKMLEPMWVAALVAYVATAVIAFATLAIWPAEFEWMMLWPAIPFWGYWMWTCWRVEAYTNELSARERELRRRTDAR